MSLLKQFPDLEIYNNIETEAQGFYNEQLIQLALSTLIANSAQAGAKKIELRCEESENQSLNIIIHDNGPGFDIDILEGLTDTTKAEGTGLGLSFVEMICKTHKGGGKQMKKVKWCYWCPVRMSHPGQLASCHGPCPEEAYVEIDK